MYLSFENFKTCSGFFISSLFHLVAFERRFTKASDVLSGQPLLLFPPSVTLTPSGPSGACCPPSTSPPPHTSPNSTLSNTHKQRVHTIPWQKIVLIYPASGINPIISNNCHRQLGSRLCDFVLIDFLTCSQLQMIWFPSDTMFIKGILHKGINRYCWLDLYEL